MQLNPLAFNGLLFNIGQKVVWRRSLICSCVSAHSNAAKPGCPVCRGKGRFWRDGVNSILGASGVDVQREWAQFGAAELGDMVVTVPSDTPAYELGQFDRVLMTNSSQHFATTLIRGDEVLPYAVLSIDEVHWIANDAVVFGGIPDVADNLVPSWEYGAPPMGITYSISGRRSPEYFVYQDFPQDRAHHQGSRLPRKVVLRKFDLFGR